jgi:cobalt-zinc-cadmium efflux system membrane fusion protein
MNTKKIIITFSLALAALSITSCKEKKQEAEQKKGFCLSDTAQKMVSIDSVKLSNMEDEIQLSGEVSFDENKVNKVFPRGSGQVIECKVTLGDKVEAGQVLAVIKSAEVAGSYADMSTADADVAITKRQLENQESLYKNGIASEREVIEARQNYEKAKAARKKIETMLSINGGSKTNAGGSYYLTAPIAGYIVEKKINAGNFIRPDLADNLFTISDLKTVWVLANVFEADIPKVKKGFNVKVSTLAYPDKEFIGTIENVSEVLDPVNKALKVRIKMPNENMLLKPEMFTKVVVSNKEGKLGICIPTTSIIQQNGKEYVVVYNSNCDMKIAEISSVKTVGEKTFIKEGSLQQGQKIIVQNQLLIFQKLLNI